MTMHFYIWTIYVSINKMILKIKLLRSQKVHFIGIFNFLFICYGFVMVILFTKLNTWFYNGEHI